MYKNISTKIIAVFLSVILILSATVISYAGVLSYHDVYLSSSDLKTDAKKTIQTVLDEARYSATDSVPYRVIFPSGSYTLIDSGLHIYSNTYLSLKADTTLTRNGNFPLIRTGRTEENSTKYNGYRNIYIDGGIWNGNYNKSCNIRMSHSQNIAMINMTVCNNTDAHLTEVAAIDGLYVYNCTFTGSKRTNSSSNEALQIDIMHSASHFPNAGACDDTPCRNIRVEGCNFNNLTAGIGTRSAVIGIYFDNINIVGNKFTGIKERAIVCFNYKNSNISGNTISAAAGIELKYMNGSSVSKCFFMPNGKTASKVSSKANVNINGNTISIKKTSIMPDACGIMVYGRKLSKAEGGVKKGDYTIKNVYMYNNNIKVSGNGKGMVLNGTKSSKIYGSSIKMSGYKKGGNYNNISLNSCRDVNIYSNSFSGAAKHGICVYKSSKGITIRDNKISNCFKFGVYVESGSYITEYPNSFKKCSASMYIGSSKTGNNTSKTSIKSVKKSGKKVKLKWSKKSGVSSYKIYRAVAKDGAYKLIKTTSSASYTDSSVKKGKKYYYKIRTVKKSGASSRLSGYSAVKSVKV